MNYFLAKTEPHEYGIDDLERDGTTSWVGVKNPQAMAYLRQMNAGDHVFIYHSGEKTVAGEALVKEPGQIPVFEFLRKFKAPLVTLADIKAEKMFADLKLVRQSRLSVMEVPESFVTWIHSR